MGISSNEAPCARTTGLLYTAFAELITISTETA
jgi:hypothetical protein